MLHLLHLLHPLHVLQLNNKCGTICIEVIKMAKKKNDLVESQDNPVTENKLTNADITRHNLELFQLPYIDPYYKPEAGIERITEYFNICIKNNMKPTLEGLATAFGVNRKTLYKWANNIDSDSLPVNFRTVIQKVYQLLNSNFTDLSINGKVNPVISIFLMKNNFGYKDQTEVLQTTTTETSKADDLINKYDIIDADFTEKND